MKLTYQLGSTAFASANDSDSLDQKDFEGVLEIIGLAFGVHKKSALYLLQNGWKQSLQDAFAGPRAKARTEQKLAKGVPDNAAVMAVVEAAIAKRIKAIVDGTMSVSIGGGRDPVKTIGGKMFAERAAEKGWKLPKDPAARNKMRDVWIESNRKKVDAEVARVAAYNATSEEVSLDEIEADTGDED